MIDKLKDIIIEHEIRTSELKKKLEIIKSEQPSLCHTDSEHKETAIFSQFITEEDSRTLNSFSSNKSDDIPFLNYLIHVLYLYRENLESIQFKSLRNVSEGIVKRNKKTFFRDKKEAITPEKRVFINKEFRSRINSLSINKEDKISRVSQKYINRCVTFSLKSVRERLTVNDGTSDEE